MNGHVTATDDNWQQFDTFPVENPVQFPSADSWEKAMEDFQSSLHSDDLAPISSIRTVLSAIPPETRADALVDLVEKHLQRSWQIQRGYFLDDYIREFGGEYQELSSKETIPAELVQTEFVARHGFFLRCDHPSIAEAQFTSDGNQFVWGVEDGRVFVGDIKLILKNVKNLVGAGPVRH